MNAKLDGLMRAYYADYYQTQLGLRDWQARVEWRLNEEQNLAEPNVARIEKWMDLNFAEKQVLVVGAGTGAEAVVLHQRGAQVYGIDPSETAQAILNEKAAVYAIPPERFLNATGEKIPFPDRQFDFVYCHTVLEHVQDVEQSIKEMVRVCKVGGLVYIQTPDYRFPYEGHYKSDRPGFSSKWFTRLLYWLQRKPVKFLSSVNFVNAPELDKIFFGLDVLTIRLSPPWLIEWDPVKHSRFFGFTEKTGIGKDQFIFLKRLA
jgi:SAM-dependent methyltransferase